MFWADKITIAIEERFTEKIAGKKPLIIRDEKTMSGRVHVGSLRGVVIHGIIAEILTEKKISNTYFFEINDYDPFDGLPVYLDQKVYLPFMGRILIDVPSPDPKFKNFAEYVADEFIQVVNKIGFTPKLYRSSTLYLDGKMNECIALALNNAEKIREIYKTISGSDKGIEWLPVQVVCEKCHKVGTTKAVSWDGKEVTYRCEPDLVTWAQGCGHEGKVSPFDGRAKLPWKVEWAAKWKVMGVDIEGAGKDHATKGGSREISATIAKEVFNYPNPFDIPYNFLVVGGKKMSSSKGLGSTAKDITDLLPPELTRLLMLRAKPPNEINFEPNGDTIPILYDYYDKVAGAYFEHADSDDSRLFYLAQLPNQRKKIATRFMPRFSLVAYLSQMPHIKLDDEVSKMKDSKLTTADKVELKERVAYAENWLKKYSPEKFRLTIYTDQIPPEAKKLTPEEKQALRALLAYLEPLKIIDGQELHTKLHAIKTELQIDPQILFAAIYKSFLNADHGPKAGWFLSVLPHELLIRRLQEVAK